MSLGSRRQKYFCSNPPWRQLLSLYMRYNLDKKRAKKNIF
jgi:hypothetical protein